MSEKQKLIDRLCNDPSKTLVKFGVSKGEGWDDATPEERAAEINRCLDAVSEPIPCGGCGATSSSQRCVGCMHDFGTTDSEWVRDFGKPLKEQVHPFDETRSAFKIARDEFFNAK